MRCVKITEAEVAWQILGREPGHGRYSCLSNAQEETVYIKILQETRDSTWSDIVQDVQNIRNQWEKSGQIF